MKDSATRFEITVRLSFNWNTKKNKQPSNVRFIPPLCGQQPHGIRSMHSSVLQNLKASLLTELEYFEISWPDMRGMKSENETLNQ